jgi:hypothetical protein
MVRVLVLKSKMLSGILLTKLPTLPNSIKMPLISQEFQQEMPRTVLQLTNISHLNKWVSLKFKAHQLQKVNTPGENLFIQSEEWDNLSQILDPQKEQVPQFSSNGLMEMDSVQRKKISLRTLRETQLEILSNSTRIPHTSQELDPQTVMIPPQKTTISENREPQETSLKSMVLQLQRVNTPGENQCTQSEEWDNLSQILDQLKEPVPQSLSNGLMVTDSVQRKKISLRILRETQLEILSNSTRIPHTSQELVPQTVMIPPQKTTISENRELLETSLKSMVLQPQRVNMAGDNQCIQLEVKDNLSQILDQLKEPVHQSSSNGLMETDLVQRKKISLRILRETQLEIPASSTKTPLISQVLAQQTVTMRLHKANTMVDQSSLETDI